MEKKTAKQQAIEKAYQEVGLPFIENVIYDNGWLRIRPSQYSSFYDNVELLKLNSHTHSIRPKSLKGIETNNGWIRIESEEDLPKDETLFKGIVKEVTGGKTYQLKDNIYYSKTYKVWMYENTQHWVDAFVTHYKPIEPELLPIY